LVVMETRLHVDRFEELFRLGCEAGKVLHKEMKIAVKARTQELVDAMGPRQGQGGGEYGDRDTMMVED